MTAVCGNRAEDARHFHSAGALALARSSGEAALRAGMADCREQSYHALTGSTESGDEHAAAPFQMRDEMRDPAVPSSTVPALIYR
jgi:hypothetical protein